MAIYSFHISRECGGLSEKPPQRSFAAEPEEIERGIADVLKQWASGACIGECLTISVRRSR